MANSDPLVPFGIAIVVILGALILIPFLRGKSDLLTAWNTLLLGLILFAGFGSIEVKYVPSFPWEHLNFQPTKQEVNWYMLATTAFIVVLVAAYYLNTPARSFAQKRLRNWPEVTAPVTFFVLGCCFALIVISMAFQRVTFIGPLSFGLATSALPAAGIFSFAQWRRNRLNLFWLAIFVGVMLVAGLYAMIVSSGRRLLLSVILGPVLYEYWTSIRFWRPSRAIITIALAGVMILGVSVIYAKFRWYSLGKNSERRTASGVIEQLRSVRKEGDLFGAFWKNELSYLAQGAGKFALLTERYTNQRVLMPVPLNTLRFLATYPIPRKIWSGKPKVIGETLARDTAGIAGTNWGLGVAGQGAFEGGIPALILYAVLLAFGVRILDEPLRLQPTNPFLILMHATALPNVMGIPRGDMGIMIGEVAKSVLIAFLLGVVCRWIFGTRTSTRPASAQARISMRYGTPHEHRFT